MSTNLDNWLKQNNYFKKNSENDSPTHLLYSGGTFYIPREKEYEFLTHYAAELSKKTKLYYVETRPKIFKYMVDIDITDDHYWTTEEMINLISIIQKTVFEFFDTNQMTICCTSPVKNKNDGMHTGIHLIWPNLYINSETALCIRRGIIQKLKESDIKINKSWEDIIDETIYTRNGYRMVGSDKMSHVTNSNGIKEKIAENRPLSLLFVMDSEGNLSEKYYDRLNGNTKSLILETSIRYVLDTYIEQGMNVNKFPTWLEEDPLEKSNLKSNKGKGEGPVGTVISSKDHQIIENFIKRNLPEKYSGSVKAVTRYPDKNLLIKTTSRYCMNIGRNHNSCGIYFFASPVGIYQKCLCSCQKMDGRKNGLCLNYTSSCYKFDAETSSILFPDENKFNFNDDKKDKKNIKKNNKKIKSKELNYVPLTKSNIEKQQQQLCDKLFNDIFT